MAALPKGAREAQNAAAMHVEAQWIEGELAAQPARADDRDLVVERHEILVEQGRLSELVPGAVDVRLLAQHRLALAVISEAAGLEYAGEPDAFDGRIEIRARPDRRVLRGGDAEQLERALLGQPILRGGQRAQWRRDARLAGKLL